MNRKFRDFRKLFRNSNARKTTIMNITNGETFKMVILRVKNEYVSLKETVNGIQIRTNNMTEIMYVVTHKNRTNETRL